MLPRLGQVDIFLPRYKEPWSIYGPVVQSALDLDYPPGKLTVWVLDDGRKESLQEHVKVGSAVWLKAGHGYCTECVQHLVKVGNMV